MTAGEGPGSTTPSLDAPGSDTDPGAAGGGSKRLLDMSRRGFLRTGSIGVLAAGVVGSVPGLGSLLSSAEADAPVVAGSATEVQGTAAAAEADTASVAQSFGAHVTDVSTGEMRLFVGNQTLQIQDPALAQRLSQAARAAQAAGR